MRVVREVPTHTPIFVVHVPHTIFAPFNGERRAADQRVFVPYVVADLFDDISIKYLQSVEVEDPRRLHQHILAFEVLEETVEVKSRDTRRDLRSVRKDDAVTR